ncbi:MAG TPA: NAD(P)H-dependent glycerol-3-phosphate dehydrogenase [Rhodocyclaceae bacterium]|nr:NAD(P)H-dependent glycerol-3-phosphate dehydrogenase [Rhodocyclaceae bacterium]HNA02954.1 NAD(P)H-dependent glycerol-3-phosphate dehydrogenase [Rhodocyclaceae bacterium]HNB78102.1 NAD(P)H-dependent glycerol-3-phosphate dehydrogenase [Rhodocyclaceae bacterium]HNC60553.1 NAD(P)H-dependent glycerol-3-phosphate dehydrogenase [Rhodocyclaceae bacterium]HNH13641.1 NAD(P)H-dependent glycerol-3-phosphate dehydrogenase [Rhodocyclaceae bacterium]
MRLAILGAGAWGTALAASFAPWHDTLIWSRDAVQAAGMRAARENARYLPGCTLPASLVIESDLARAVDGGDLLLVATPLSGLRATLESLRRLEGNQPLLWACKGLEAGSAKLPHQIVAEVLGEGVPCGALTGPSFADEVARGLPTAITLASRDAAFARETAAALHHPRLRIYANTDVVGAEIGGAVKNVMAIAAGVSDGMGFGLNARAALITRGLAEIARLGEALGARRDTFMGLAGMGDLILTCTGDLSRNRRVGLALAQGKALDDILRELGHIAEGVNTAREVDQLARKIGVDMPITRAVVSLLFEGRSAKQAVEALLARDPKLE